MITLWMLRSTCSHVEDALWEGFEGYLTSSIHVFDSGLKWNSTLLGYFLGTCDDYE
jgi:hypothetical protein